MRESRQRPHQSGWGQPIASWHQYSNNRATRLDQGMYLNIRSTYFACRTSSLGNTWWRAREHTARENERMNCPPGANDCEPHVAVDWNICWRAELVPICLTPSTGRKHASIQVNKRVMSGRRGRAPWSALFDTKTSSTFESY
jgi:hypothetical protein